MKPRILGTKWSGVPFCDFGLAERDEVLQLLAAHGLVYMRRQAVDLERLWQVAALFGGPIGPVPLASAPQWALDALSDERRGYQAEVGSASLVKGRNEWRLRLSDVRVATAGHCDIVVPSLLLGRDSILSGTDADNHQVDIFETAGEGDFPRPDIWHSDASFLAEPPSIGMLYADCAPTDGSGATMFCDMTLSLDAVSPKLRGFLSDCSAIHAVDAHIRRHGEGIGHRLTIPAVPADVDHPVVRIVGDRECLFVNPFYTDRIVGLNYTESNALLDTLFQLCTSPEFTFTHRWRAGDLLLWDNRSTMHYSLRNLSKGGQRKLMRAVVGGERPRMARRAGPG